MTKFPPICRLTGALTLGLLLAACNNKADDVVRNYPQAVHPSPSALAQRGSALVPGTFDVICGEEGLPACE